MEEDILKVKIAKRFLARHRNEITRYETVMESSLNTIGMTMLRQAKIARKILEKGGE